MQRQRSPPFACRKGWAPAMKNTRLIIFIFLTVPLLATSHAQAPTQPFSLNIRAPESSQSGSNTTVKITLTNVSDHLINILRTNPECDYQVQVNDHYGKP